MIDLRRQLDEARNIETRLGDELNDSARERQRLEQDKTGLTRQLLVSQKRSETLSKECAAAKVEIKDKDTKLRRLLDQLDVSKTRITAMEELQGRHESDKNHLLSRFQRDIARSETDYVTLFGTFIRLIGGLPIVLDAGLHEPSPAILAGIMAHFAAAVKHDKGHLVDAQDNIRDAIMVSTQTFINDSRRSDPQSTDSTTTALYFGTMAAEGSVISASVEPDLGLWFQEIYDSCTGRLVGLYVDYLLQWQQEWRQKNYSADDVAYKLDQFTEQAGAKAPNSEKGLDLANNMIRETLISIVREHGVRKVVGAELWEMSIEMLTAEAAKHIAGQL